MSTTTKISLTELDFDQIKANLKTFLQGQTELSGFDFEGSTMNILLDVLAANTHYSAFLANMLANEMFLDTATQRDSIVSIAKLLSYVPASKTAASLVANITVRPQGGHTPTIIVIPRNTIFSTTLNDKTYNFVTMANEVVRVDSGDYIAQGVSLKEGTIVQFAYEVDSQNPEQKFIIPNLDVDTTTLVVKVRTSRAVTTTTTWNKATSALGLNENSEIYWLQETNKGYFEVYFGDDVIGKKPANGNIVILEYLVTNGEEANGAGNNDTLTAPALSHVSGSCTYTYANVDYTTDDVTISVVDAASGGAEKESTASIKFLAPMVYSSQERAVTTEDYKAVILQNRPSIESVTVWGGEDNVPVDLGKVYISLKPYSGTTVSDYTKELITDTILASRNVVTIQPVIVDPDYTYIHVDTKVYYDTRQTDVLASDIAVQVFDVLRVYGDQYLEKFDRGLRFSRLTTLIDNTNDAILSNETTLTLEKRLNPTLAASWGTTMYFGNAFNHPYDGYQPVVSSTAFTYGGETCYFDDDGAGLLRIYKMVGTVKTVVLADAGDVVYGDGTITIDPLTITAIDGDYLKVRVDPLNMDLDVQRNQILIVDSGDITIDVTGETQ